MPIAALIFFLVPLIEMIVLIEVGGTIGALPTVGLVVLTAVVGVWLLRLEGISTINRVQTKLEAGELPGTELLEGVMLIFGGALLLTPGFVTDTMGFICLIPGLRRPLAKRIIASGSFSRMHTFTYRSHQQGPNGPGARTGGGAGPGNNNRHTDRGGHTIDGEYQEEIDERIDRKE